MSDSPFTPEQEARVADLIAAALKKGETATATVEAQLAALEQLIEPLIALQRDVVATLKLLQAASDGGYAMRIKGSAGGTVSVSQAASAITEALRSIDQEGSVRVKSGDAARSPQGGAAHE